MKKYHVYGLGNALVDIEYEISPEFLTELGVEKSVMTLINKDRAAELFSQLEHLPHFKAPGGSAGNTITAIQQLGNNAFYSCKVANDELGEFYYQALNAAGVTTNINHANRLSGTTGTCLAFVTPDADRTMNTHLGITETFSTQEIRTEILSNSEYIYIEGYLVASPSAREAAILARETAEKAGVKTSITLSDPNMVKFFKDGLCEMIGQKVDLLFANEEEARLFTEKNNHNEIAEELKNYAKTFVITLGKRGALAFDGYQLNYVPAYQTEVLDTLGAGDLFAGAFLFALTNRMNFLEAADIANMAAAKIVNKFGPRLDQAEIKTLLREIQEKYPRLA